MTATIILASQSPRRRQLIGALGLPVVAMTSGVSEEVDDYPDPIGYAGIVARRKAEHVAALPRLQQVHRPIVVAADTIVVVDGQILGKPASADEAHAMLRQLRNRDHLVHSALHLIDIKTQHHRTGVSTASVTMRNYSDAEIEVYIATGDPLDKAGSYAIQHPIFKPVSALEGCYLGVVGLSLCQLILDLAGLGVSAAWNPEHLLALHEGHACEELSRLSLS